MEAVLAEVSRKIKPFSSANLFPSSKVTALLCSKSAKNRYINIYILSECLVEKKKESLGKSNEGLGSNYGETDKSIEGLRKSNEYLII